MLTKAFLVLSGLFLVGAAQSDFYGDLSLFHELQQEPYGLKWDWHNPGVNSRRAIAEDLSSDEDSSEREPLAKDYRDPPAASSEQKPVLIPKPKPNLKSIPEKPEEAEPHQNNKKPESPEKPENPKGPWHGLIPDGIIDVNSDGFGNPFGPFSPDFDFGPAFGVNSKPLGFADLFDSFQGNQWWKGMYQPRKRKENRLKLNTIIHKEIMSSPFHFDISDITNNQRHRYKEGRDIDSIYSPLNLDFYSVSKRRRKEKPKKIILFEWDLD